MVAKHLSQEEEERIREEMKDEKIWACFGTWNMIGKPVLVDIYWHRETGIIIFIQSNDGPYKGKMADPDCSNIYPENAMRQCSAVLVMIPSLVR